MITFARDPSGYMIEGGNLIAPAVALNNTWHGYTLANPSIVFFKNVWYLIGRGIGPGWNGGNSCVGKWTCAPSDFINGRTGWFQHPNPIILSGPSGSENSNGILDPVACVSPDGSTLMVYSNSTNGAFQTLLHTSTDGDNFTYRGPVGINAGTPCPMVINGKMRVWTTNFNADYNTKRGFRMECRESNDGGYSFGSTVVSNIYTSSTPGDLDYQSLVTARWFYESPYHYLFIACGSAQADYPEGVMVQRSTDGNNWQRNPHPVMLRGSAGQWDEGAIWSPSVARTNTGRLVMYLECAGAAPGSSGGSTQSNANRDTEYGGFSGPLYGHGIIAYAQFNGLLNDANWNDYVTSEPKLVRNQKSGSFMVPGALTNGAGVKQFSGKTWPTDARWTFERFNGFYRISATGAGPDGALCVTIDGSSRTVSANAVLQPWSGSQSQQWMLVDQGNFGWRRGEGPFRFVNRYSGMALEVGFGSTSDNVTLTQGVHFEANRQRFEVFTA